MKTLKIFATMAMIMMMSVSNVNAQEGRSRQGNGGSVSEKTYHFNQNNGRGNSGNGHAVGNVSDRQNRVGNSRGGDTRGRQVASAPAVRHDIKGYEDRVRFHDGRWHYFRDGRWYSYDHFIEPAYFYSHPLSTFGKVMIGTAAVATLASFISALAR